MNVAVFCSGNGTNLEAIIKAVRQKKLRVNISLVICDQSSAYALKRAKRAGIKTVLVERNKFRSKALFEKEILRELKKEKVGLIVLAGYMRILGPTLLKAYNKKIINIHPTLLPAFKGARGIKDAFNYGVKVTGITVHFVDDKIDHGPIIMQEPILVKKTDTLKALEERIHKAEHKLYYKAIGLFASHRLRISKRKVRIL